MIMMEKDSVAGVKQILIREPKRHNGRLKAQKSNSLTYSLTSLSAAHHSTAAVQMEGFANEMLNLAYLQ